MPLQELLKVAVPHPDPLAVLVLPAVLQIVPQILQLPRSPLIALAYQVAVRREVFRSHRADHV